MARFNSWEHFSVSDWHFSDNSPISATDIMIRPGPTFLSTNLSSLQKLGEESFEFYEGSKDDNDWKEHKELAKKSAL
jgi:hypothetical protein